MDDNLPTPSGIWEAKLAETEQWSKAFERFAVGNFKDGVDLLGEDPLWADKDNGLDGPFYLGFPGAAGWGEGLLVASLLKRHAQSTGSQVEVFATPAVHSVIKGDASFKINECDCYASAKKNGAGHVRQCGVNSRMA